MRCPIVWVPCLWAEVWATSPALPNEMSCSGLHLIRSSDVVPARIVTCRWLCSISCLQCGSFFDQIIKFLSLALQRIAYLILKRAVERDTTVGNVSNRARHPTVRSRMSSDRSPFSSISSLGLTLLSMAHQALIIVSVSTSMGNVEWKFKRCVVLI